MFNDFVMVMVAHRYVVQVSDTTMFNMYSKARSQIITGFPSSFHQSNAHWHAC